MPQKTEIIAILFNVSSWKAGHDITYQKAVEKAAGINGWSYKVLVPQEFDCKDFSVSWIPCLDKPYIDHSSRNIFVRLFRLFTRFTILRSRLSTSIKNNLKQIIFSENNTIIFLESFSVIQLVSFTFAMNKIKSQHNIKCWLLYRHNYRKNGSWNDILPGYLSHRICLKMNHILQKRFKERFRILSDSKTLSLTLSKLFNCKVNAVPIPHLPLSADAARGAAGNSTTFWWPGRPDKEKGMYIIDKISRMIRPEDKLKLKISRKADIRNFCSHVLALDDPLTESDYYKNMADADAILLPYDPVRYTDSTSGIFMEAVCSQKVTFVTAGTWMANELKQHNLDELIIDWEQNNLIHNLISLTKNQKIKEKIARMRGQYLEVHGEKAFASAMLKINGLTVSE